MNRRRFVGAIGAALAGAMCGRAAVPAPRGVSLGHTTCVRCRAIVFGLEGTGQAVFADGSVRYYDDIGCMATDPEALRGKGQLYVQLAGVKGWARVEDVTFAAPAGVKTAQGYGYLAYPEEEARQVAPDHWARGWNDLVKELAARKK